MAITIEQAKVLTGRDELHSEINRNSDGTCQRWKVNGEVKRWVRSPDRIRVPLKHGFYSFDTLTEADIDLVHLAHECRRNSINGC